MKKLSRKSTLLRRLKTKPAIVAAVIVILLGGGTSAVVRADSIQQQIDTLSTQNA